MALTQIVHELLVTDGDPNGPTTLNLMSSTTDSSGYGYALAQKSLSLSNINEELYYDPLTFAGRHGRKVRGFRFDNREITFQLHIKGSSQDDMLFRLGQLEQIAHRVRQWNSFDKGAQPQLKWRTGSSAVACFAPLLGFIIQPQPGWGGLDNVNNRIDGVQLKAITEPDLCEYARPMFYPVGGFASNLNRPSGTTTGAYLPSGTSLQSSWTRNTIGTTSGHCIVWFKCEWANADANTRNLFTTEAAADGQPFFFINKDSSGNLNFSLYDTGSASRKSIQMVAATVNTIINPGNTGGGDGLWYGVYAGFTPATQGGMRAYLLTDGITLSTQAGSTAFNLAAAAWGGIYTLASAPQQFNLGGNANAEMDCCILANFIGFEISTDSTQWPFTRDRGSLMVYAGDGADSNSSYRYVRNQLTPANGGAIANGRGHVLCRHVPGNRPGKLSMRWQPVNNSANTASQPVKRLRVWSSEHPQDQGGYQLTFIDTVSGSPTYGTGWSAQATATAYNGANAALNSATTDAMANPAVSKAVSFTTTSWLNRLQAGTYLVFLRAWTATSADAIYRVTLVAAPTTLDSGTITVSAPNASRWQLVPMGTFAVPLGGVRPGGTYAFGVNIYANHVNGASNHFVDGLLFLPIDPEVPPLQLTMNTVVTQGSTVVEAHYEARPDTFRLNGSNNDLGQDWSQSGKMPTLFPISDTRLWFSWDCVSDINANNFPINNIGSNFEQAAVDLWFTPRSHVPR